MVRWKNKTESFEVSKHESLSPLKMGFANQGRNRGRRGHTERKGGDAPREGRERV